MRLSYFKDFLNFFFALRISLMVVLRLNFEVRCFLLGLFVSYLGSALPYLDPEFLPSASNVTYTRGDLAILFCAVKHLGTKYVSWRKTSDPNPLTIGTLVYVPDSRFHVSYIDYRGEWNLYIKNVSHDDAGLYECQVSTAMRDSRKYVLLNVKDPPITTTVAARKKTDVIISGPLSVDVGKELFVTCNVSAVGYNTDLFHIEWFFDGNIVDEENDRLNITIQISHYFIQSTLTIKQALTKDSGEYICRTSSNQVGRQHVFVLNGGKSSNTKRGTDQTDTMKASSKTNNGNTHAINIYVDFLPKIIMSIIFIIIHS